MARTSTTDLTAAEVNVVQWLEPLGSALQVVRVNAGGTALEYATAGGWDALTANPLSQFAATTSLELKGVISDETGSWALVFATSPTLVTPVLGAATATSINGATITSGTLNGSVTGTNTWDQTIANTSDATSHTATLSATGWSIKLVEGTGITLTTTGTSADWIVTIAATWWGTGTVTATAGSLTSNSVVLGAGTTDTKVSTWITTDGTAQLNLWVNATTIGKVKMFGNTSGDVTIQPTAAAGTATVQTLPATTGTLVNRVTTANGVSASNSDWALTVSLGAIAPTTVNTVTISGASTPTLAVTGTTTVSGTNTGNQTIANTSDATSHTVTLSASGGSVQLIEGSNITLTTWGTGSAWTVTIASTASGTWDVVWPASATDNAIPRFDTTTGKLLQNSWVTIWDTNIVSWVATLNTQAINATAQADFSYDFSDTILSGWGLTFYWATHRRINDGWSNELIKFPTTSVAGAVNEFTISNAATGNWPILEATGWDTNIDVNITTKGTWVLKVNWSAIWTWNVTKVGTPVNNQVGVWTGDGTLEGDTALTFDTTTDTLATTLITATTVTANLVWNVTGNASGTAATVTSGTQAAITSAANLATVWTITSGTWNATDIAVADWGTWRSTGTTAYSLIATGTTATGAQQTLANGATTEILVWGGASALPVWTTAQWSGAPVRATSPTLTTPNIGTPSAWVLTNCTGTATGLTSWITNGLKSATTTVDVSAATAPSSGQVLTATSSTTATWQTPSGGTTGYTTTATSGGTTTLTSSSTYYQYFTGTLQQTITLPVTSTLTTWFSFYFTNKSTNTIDINSSWANNIVTIASGASCLLTCILTSWTTAASWNFKYDGLTTATKLAGTADTTMTFPTTSATIARTDSAQTFTGVQTMTSPNFTTPVLWTPTSGTLTNCTGLPVAGITASTSTALWVWSIELWHASDTSITRVSAWVIAVEWVTIPTLTSTSTFATWVKTFLAGMFALRNVANTFNALFTNTNTADRTYTLKDANGTLAFTTDITGTNSGTNTWDQTSIVGITWTLAQFNTAVTDAELARTDAANTFTGIQSMTSPAITTSITTPSTSFDAFNTTATTLNLWGAATTLTVWGTPTTAITHNYSTNATATATTKTLNVGTGGAAGSTTNINIGSSVAGTTTVNSPTISLGSTTGATTTGTIELWHASDTTISRSAAGVIAVEGVTVPTISSTSTLTNKRITKRVVTTTDDATAVIDTDITDEYELSAMANATTFTVTGTPTDWQTLLIRLKDNGSARALTWTMSGGVIGVTLPTTTVISKWSIIGFKYFSSTTSWKAIAVSQEV